MNSDRRDRIRDILRTLDYCMDLQEFDHADNFEHLGHALQDILDEENEVYSKMPDNLRNSERGKESNDAIKDLELAVSDFEFMSERLFRGDSKKSLENVIEDVKSHLSNII